MKDSIETMLSNFYEKGKINDSFIFVPEIK